MTRQSKNSIILVLTAFIWGIAFVAQSAGGDAIGPFSFNGLRSFIGALVLLPVIRLLDRINKKNDRIPKTKAEKRRLWRAGVLCGVLLFFASSLQQMGLYLGSTAGKAGFLTAFYILFVPMIGLFLKKKCGWNGWIGVILALGGFYLLCVKEGFTVRFSDLLLLLCALCFSFHILLVDRYSPRVDGVRLSCIQFFTVGVLSVPPTIGFDILSLSGNFGAWAQAFLTPDAWIPLLYAGVLSCGVAYTLQIIGQQGVNPTLAALLMSLESVFSALAGWILLQEVLSLKEFLGCALIFSAILLAQLPADLFKKRRK